jgi:hypothetical protein
LIRSILPTFSAASCFAMAQSLVAVGGDVTGAGRAE